MRVAALVLALSATVSWGIGGVLLKRGSDVVSPLTILVFQYVLGAVLLGGWIAASGRLATSLTSVEERWPALVVIALFQTAGYVFFVLAVARAGEGSLPTAAVLAIASAYPALVAVLSAPFLGESLEWSHAVAVALIVGGVIVAQV